MKKIVKKRINYVSLLFLNTKHELSNYLDDDRQRNEEKKKREKNEKMREK